MNKIAFVFSGQGAQKVGMGKDFYENSEISKNIFDTASEKIGLDLRALCFEENDLLDKTEYTQAALVTTCLAIVREVEKRGLYADVTAGLSLGEYTAIAVAGGMSDMDAISVVRERGKFMQDAVPEGEGAMSAILGMTGEQVESVIEDMENVFVANYNCPGQIVITGKTESVQEANEKLLSDGAKRAMLLNVSGPFHSPFLVGVGEKLGELLKKVSFTKLQIPYVTNVTGRYVTDVKETKELLSKQVASSVRWQDSVENMIEDGVDVFVEIGVGKTLSGFIRKVNKNVKTYSISTWKDMEKVISELGGVGRC
ncbi:ACP S-malonyltransferase [Faecalimonas canis]